MPSRVPKSPAARRQIGEYLADLETGDMARLLDRMPGHELVATRRTWADWAYERQLPPTNNWRIWLMMAGRGFGKTRAGAEWVDGIAQDGGPDTRIALVGATRADVRDIMVEGESGIMNLITAGPRPVWEPSLGRLSWSSGATAWVFSGCSPEALRGPQHSHAWCDELAKWTRARETWDNLWFGLRMGDVPRALITTTPRPIPLLREILGGEKGAGDIVVTRGRTIENGTLSDAYLKAVKDSYAGTRLGRQELDGELIEDAEDALWTRDMLETCRVRSAPELVRVVVGVDPPAGSVSGNGGDACGIVVCGLGRDGIGYVIEDASVAGRSPQGWALAVAQAAVRHGADRVVAEANNGGTMVDAVLRAADAGLPVKLVHASRGKVARAEPVQTLYARGLVKHVGAFPALEDELCGLIVGGGYEGPGRSPDRADACVWGLSELMLGQRGDGPRVRVV